MVFSRLLDRRVPIVPARVLIHAWRGDGGILVVFPLGPLSRMNIYS